MSVSTPYPFRYLTPDELERRLNASPSQQQAMLGINGSEWDTLLDDIIAEESAFVHRQLVSQGVVPEDYNSREQFLGRYPQVRQAMVRLCRASFNRIEEDGLQSESVGDHSENFRAPGELRAEVSEFLGTIEPPQDETGDEDADDGTSVSLL